MEHNIDLNHCSLQALFNLVASKKEVQLSKECEAKIKECRNFLDEVISTSSAPIYGINTGFGSLYKNSISGEHLEELQVNLVRSHACGMGEEVPQEVVSWMILLKILGLSKGHSGVQLETVQLLVEFYNRGILPVVYQQGSLGASGDLAPLAHLSLALFGEGEVHGDAAKLNSMEVLNEHQLKPITLKAKEGLALLNGTQFMSGYACFLLQKAQHLMEWADALAALSVDAYDGRKEPFQHNVNEIRKQIGQQITAKKVRTWLEGSELIEQAKKHVQDPYSFR
ncbi:MAG: aromatic amino acid ammonia-lyase, partial [Flavobacteriales bacterium]|nr:aromatic amino acid ammonia-lyase [Flavobacteriales bacterium]